MELKRENIPKNKSNVTFLLKKKTKKKEKNFKRLFFVILYYLFPIFFSFKMSSESYADKVFNYSLRKIIEEFEYNVLISFYERIVRNGFSFLLQKSPETHPLTFARGGGIPVARGMGGRGGMSMGMGGMGRGGMSMGMGMGGGMGRGGISGRMAFGGGCDCSEMRELHEVIEKRHAPNLIDVSKVIEKSPHPEIKEYFNAYVLPSIQKLSIRSSIEDIEHCRKEFEHLINMINEICKDIVIQSFKTFVNAKMN